MNTAHQQAIARTEQSGNILVALFGAIALIGLLGMAIVTILKNPMSGGSSASKYTVTENDILSAAMLVARHSMSHENPDCDSDGMIEPVEFATGSVAAPPGGGLIPPEIGAAKADPWGNPFGYCVWDHGELIKHEECGGEGANRLRGGNTDTGIAIAIISAGPNRTFQTSCEDWTAPAEPVVSSPDGSDDMVHLVPYGSFLLPQTSQDRLNALPEAVCMAHTIGVMRTTMGAVQVCTETGWTEVGTSAYSGSAFVPVSNAVLGQQYTSNAINFSGYLNKRDIKVIQGEAILVINGAPAGSAASVTTDDTVALRANAAAAPETTLAFALSVGGVRKDWSIRTREYAPASLTITPSSQDMTMTATGTLAYGDPVGFTVRNTGEAATGPMMSSTLSNASNFEFHSGGSFVGDGCAMQNLASNATCRIDLRPRSNSQGTYTSTLTARAASTNASATLNLTVNPVAECCSDGGGGEAANGSWTPNVTGLAAFAASCPDGVNCPTPKCDTFPGWDAGTATGACVIGEQCFVPAAGCPGGIPCHSYPIPFICQ